MTTQLFATDAEVHRFYLTARVKRCLIVSGLSTVILGGCAEVMSRIAEEMLQQNRQLLITNAQNYLKKTQMSQDDWLGRMAAICYNLRLETDAFGKRLFAAMLKDLLNLRRDSLTSDIFRYLILPDMFSVFFSFGIIAAADEAVSPYLRKLISDQTRQNLAVCASAAPSYVNPGRSATTFSSIIEHEAFLASWWFPRAYHLVYCDKAYLQPYALCDSSDAQRAFLSKMYSKQQMTAQDIVVMRTVWGASLGIAVEAQVCGRYIFKVMQPHGTSSDASGQKQHQEEREGLGKFFYNRIKNVWVSGIFNFAVRNAILGGATVAMSEERLLGDRALSPYNASLVSYYCVNYLVGKWTRF